MSKIFDWSTARLIWTDKTENGMICEVYRDANDNGTVRHRADQAKVKRQWEGVQTLKNSKWNDKQTSYFNERVRGGDRIIGQVPKWAIVEFPHIFDDPKELMKFFDKYPQWKRIPVNWTSVKGRNKYQGSTKAASDSKKKDKLIIG